MAYRILVASLVVCLLLVVGLLWLERTGFVEIDEREIQPEVVSCQIGHKDMEVRVLGQGTTTAGRSSRATSSGSPRSAGAPCTTGTGPRRASLCKSTSLILPHTSHATRGQRSWPKGCPHRKGIMVLM